MGSLETLLVARVNFWVYVLLMMIGLYGMLVKDNLVKKIIGMNIFQTAIILFYISIGAKKHGTLPILVHGVHDAHPSFHAIDYINPLPHVLMLTAIVVAVATLGVALALVIRIHQRYGSLQESEILSDNRMEPEP
jgi:multicomponent Na+:H+ antiporter subunit C